jgi:signal transduction histidine kinase
LKEIVTNAVKHSQAKLVRIEITVAGKLIHFDITDDGSGFDPDQKFGGNGLKNLWNRADQLKAKLSLNTAPDKGTHWQLEVEI